MSFARSRWLRLLTIGAAVALIGCGGEEAPAPSADPAASRPAPAPQPSAPTPPVLSRDLPDEMPADLPLIADAEVIGVSPPVEGGVAVTLEAAGSPAEVADAYQRRLEVDGWTVVPMPEGGEILLVAQRAGASAMIYVGPSESGSVVKLVVAEHE